MILVFCIFLVIFLAFIHQFVYWKLWAYCWYRVQMIRNTLVLQVMIICVNLILVELLNFQSEKNDPDVNSLASGWGLQTITLQCITVDFVNYKLHTFIPEHHTHISFILHHHPLCYCKWFSISGFNHYIYAEGRLSKSSVFKPAKDLSRINIWFPLNLVRHPSKKKKKTSVI